METVSGNKQPKRTRSTRNSAAAAAAVKVRTKPAKQEKVVLSKTQREAKQYAGTSEQIRSEKWKEEGTEALRDDPLVWQIPHAIFVGANIPLTAQQRACMQPTGNGDSWFNDAVIDAYAHLIQRAHMEEHPSTDGSTVQVVSPAVTLSQIIREGQRIKLTLLAAKVESATTREAESAAKTDELERALRKAEERAQELTDQDAFEAVTRSARTETEAWEQVRRLSRRATSAQGAEKEATKMRAQAQKKARKKKDMIASRDATIIATGKKIEKKKPDRIFSLTAEGGHWWMTEIDRAARIVYQYDGFNHTTTVAARRALAWWTEECGFDRQSEEDDRKWRIRCATIPQQPNGVDCGPFACAALRRLMMVSGRPTSTSASPAPQIARDWGFTGEHGPTIRLKMATELKQGKLQSLKEEEGGYTEREKWMTW